MKKLLIKTALFMFAVLVLITACEKDIALFDSSMNLVGFSASSATIVENTGEAVSVLLYLGAPEGSGSTQVTLEVDTAGLGASAAVENVDFTISSKSVLIDVGETNVDILPVDNDIFTGDKKFYLVITSNSSNYMISAQKRLLVTISDDEHPLKAWIGTYKVEAASYGSPGAWDEEWSVITTPVEGDVTKLNLQGIGSVTSDPIIATLDAANLTITIDPGQSIGDPYGAGPTAVYVGTLNLEFNESESLTGTIMANGNMSVDMWGHKITEGPWEGAWDVFNTSWIKQ